jgi:voltage-gated sodium channel
MSCNWFWRFWGSAFNIFDFVVVSITVASLVPTLDLQVVSTLRLLRAFRVVRIFGRLSSARRIITAIGSSIEPVCNVLIIVTGIMCVFSMFGATAYQDAPHFTNTATAMYTMFRILTLEGWPDIVTATDEFYPAGTSIPPKLFVLTYIFIVVRWLMNDIMEALSHTRLL